MVFNGNSSLDKILAPILDDLKTFDIEYKRAVKSDVPLINTITKYMMRKKGKIFVHRLLFYLLDFVESQLSIHIGQQQ